MIEIKMTGKCKDCECADLEVQRLDILSFVVDGDEKLWSIRCIHEDACERMSQAERREE